LPAILILVKALHVVDEVFCAASLVLPDKAGRILNIAGWTGPSTFGIRVLTPSDTPGVQGTTDWEQDPQNVALQVRVYDRHWFDDVADQ
jgi:hypothetical protein